nr:MAG TPA: transmembrane protein [Caudoviricetes sp.]
MFLVLKLTGLITWSWTVVLIPLWISLVMLVIFLIVTIIVVKNNFKTKR